MESHHPEHDLKPNESKTADLEIAVLVQELMAMREDKADLRLVLLIQQKKMMFFITYFIEKGPVTDWFFC